MCMKGEGEGVNSLAPQQGLRKIRQKEGRKRREAEFPVHVPPLPCPGRKRSELLLTMEKVKQTLETFKGIPFRGGQSLGRWRSYLLIRKMPNPSPVMYGGLGSEYKGSYDKHGSGSAARGSWAGEIKGQKREFNCLQTG